MAGSAAFARIERDVLRLAASIDHGRVCSYADLGAAIDVPARHVAYIVSRMDKATRAQYPVHRLVGNGGALPQKPESTSALLEAENITVANGKVRDFDQLRCLPSVQSAPPERTTRPPEHTRSARGEPALSELRGLGPASVAMLAAAGITSAAQLKQADVFALYAKLKRLFPKTSTNLLYAMIGAVDNQDWREVARERRTQVLLRLEDMGML
jgi:DNA transformation protein and related proteins